MGDENQNIDPKPDTTTANDVKSEKQFSVEHYVGQVLSGSIFTRKQVQKQYPYILFMAALMLLYIANVFHVQKLHRRHDVLTQQIKELRARSLTISSIRMTATRQSTIIEELNRREIPLEEQLSPSKVIKK